MKERPIPFRGEGVRAILDGWKTMTRKVIKEIHTTFELKDQWGVEFLFTRWLEHNQKIQRQQLKCPYGKPGDRLWVRETFTYDEYENIDGGSGIREGTLEYKADSDRKIGWRTSIHMPRWASRILLEITDIRVERVQDISESDVIKEGCGLQRWSGDEFYKWPKTAGFAELWDSINKKRGYGWDVNPWVWVISFKRIKPC
jgi:hypothetical protein